jgi:dihydroorotate dehydrogenase electron transfer subunit
MPIDVQAAVLANTRLSCDYSVLTLDAPAIAAEAEAGQFVMVKARAGSDPLLRRPFSIFEVLRDAAGRAIALTLLNKRVGVVTSLLHESEAGETIQCLGPLGRPFDVDPAAEPWMVAGGVGIAPFAMLADRLLGAGLRPRLFYGARRDTDLHCLDRFERRGIEIAISTEDGSRGDSGLVTVPLERALSSRGARPVHVYACGPTPMMRAVAASSARHGCRCDVSLEQLMGCGLGGCYSCVVRVRDGQGRAHFVRSCVNGPVFDASALVWDDLGH